MPTYDHDCAGCGGFEALRPVAQRDEPADCPGCGAPAPRVLVAPPRRAWLDDATRRAIDVNETARHRPRSSADADDGGLQRLRHPRGCGCCRGPGARSGASVTRADGAKTFPTKRPWMISH